MNAKTVPSIARFKPPGSARLPLSKEDSFRARPLRNPAVREEHDRRGRLVLCLRPRLPAWRRWLLRLMRKTGEFKFVLDEQGARTWRACDGRTTVSQLISMVSRQQGVARKEAEVSTLAFLRALGQRGLVAFLVDKPGKRRRRRSSRRSPVGNGRKGR